RSKDMSRPDTISLIKSGNLSNLSTPKSSNQTLQPPSDSSSISSRNNSPSINPPITSTSRRPRAGTMPSNFNSISSIHPFKLQSFTNNHHQNNNHNHSIDKNNQLNHPINHLTLSNHPLHHHLNHDLISQSNNLLISPSNNKSINPISLNHLNLNSSSSLSSDLNISLSLEKTRARAGTIALPPSSASSFFGKGVFSTNFTPRTSKMNEELSSIKSDDSSGLNDAELKTEAGHVRTLDYLGLDTDSPISPTNSNPPQSNLNNSEFYHHLINGYPIPGTSSNSNSSFSILANRMRASTISALTPPSINLRSNSNSFRRPSPFQTDENLFNHSHSTNNSSNLLEDDYSVPLGSANSLISQYATNRVNHLICPNDSIQSEAHDKPLTTYSTLLNLNNSNALLQPNSRPRATTVGTASLLAGNGLTIGAGNLVSVASANAVNAAAAAAVRNRAGTLAGLSKHTGYLNPLNTTNSETSTNINPIGYVTLDNMVLRWLNRLVSSTYFIIVSRACGTSNNLDITSQCVAFNRLMSIELKDGKAPFSLVLQLNEALIELKNWSGQLGEDHEMGQLVQRAVMRRPEVYRAMMDKLDTEISCSRSPTFTSCVLTLESCFQRPEVTCHNCNKQGHMAKDFPKSKSGRVNTSTSFPNIRPAVAPANFQAHYPIITPPTVFPFTNSHQNFHNNNHPTLKMTKQPDFYQPRYQEQPIPAMKSRIVEIGSSNKPKHQISVEEVTNPGDRQSVYDTGASHSLTGDLSALCRYRELTKPIPLSVATNTAQQSFVTGVGSLIYPGYNSRHIIINGVFYSPHATSTLISSAALIHLGSKMCHIGNDVLIHGNCGEPLLQANYHKDGQKWLLPVFSRLLACAIDDFDFKPSHTAAPCTEGISSINAPNSFSAMTTKTHVAEDKNDIPLHDNHQTTKDELMKWHCLFGHIGLRQIRKLLGKSSPICLLTDRWEINNCEVCLQAKSLH
ncbi:hypothetical protein O181_037259, partial [Austropuccinia psidii MF-1]|nr:hypothetical protein [Austropuccinia psidii MF-1]